MGNEEQNYDNGGWQTTGQTDSTSNAGVDSTQNNGGYYEQPQSDNGTYYTQPDNSYNNYVPEPEEGPGFSIAGMVCGILSIVLCCCNQYITGVLAIVGLVLSILAVKGHKPGRGMAIAGIVCSAIGLIIAVFLIACSLFVLANPGYMNDVLKMYEQYGLTNR
ncbi:MAG: DUF4190 domain-containing protein [Eubacteriales bacterium]|nr:DUF4190 domain-containing protein [Eubacteriales bacterium]